MTYRLLTFLSTYGPKAGILVDERVYDAAALTGNSQYASVLGILDDWSAAHDAISGATRRVRRGEQVAGAVSLEQSKLLAPVLYPGQIYAAGANFLDHIAEVNRAMGQSNPTMKELGERAWHFVKISRSSVVGHDAEVSRGTSKKLDWELELAAVIGIKARKISYADALSCVAGYTVANDLSARDRILRDKLPAGGPFHYDFLSQKSFDGACPLGPWITPACEIADPGKLAMKLWVNEVLMQDSNTDQMIFDTAEQISTLSQDRTLYPGDIILTGTPAGVGMGRSLFLAPGDRVRLWIEKIGELRHSIVE